MATVRIYKVAELLNLTSQEVMTLLKKEHGIEVKSASSTIEEVVAREFVTKAGAPAEHQGADQRLVRGLAEAAARGGSGGRAGRPAEPPKPVAPAPRRASSRPPSRPRPVDGARRAEPEPVAPRVAETAGESSATLPETPAPVRQPSRSAASPVAASSPRAGRSSRPLVAAAPPSQPRSRRRRPRPRPPAPAATAARAAAPAARAGTGRIVPPTLRLRVEDPKTGQAPPAPPRRPLLVVRPAGTPPPRRRPAI